MEQGYALQLAQYTIGHGCRNAVYGTHVLVYNNFSTLPGTKKGPRTPLDVAISKDGQHWKHVLTLEDSPINQYSYPAVIQGTDGKIHIVYTWRRQRIPTSRINPLI